MKLRYENSQRLKILFPINKTVENGTEIETTDVNLAKQLKKLGFKEVRAHNKKEGDK